MLFDEEYNIVYKQQSTLVQTEDEDGYPCEDLEVLVKWVTNKFDSVLKNKHYNVTSLNFSGYGASLVNLNEEGRPATPLYNYSKPYPKDLLQQIYDAYGGEKQFSLETASPPLGMLNSGLQLYWLKHKRPLLFEEIRHSLHFPQYLSYIFSGELATECTSVGCHTALWNYEQSSYHRWTKDEGIQRLFPGMQPVTGTKTISYKGIQLEAGVGIHDSSAALVPYLYAFDEPFLLVSTGTWSITLNPFSTAPLTFEELKKDCLCYLNVRGEQVKASRLFLGNEYSHQKQNLDKYFDRENTAAKVELNVSLLNSLINEDDPAKKLKLETAHESGPYPHDEPEEWDLGEFVSYEEAYHQMMLDLVSIQVDCINLAQGSDSIDKLVLTGGFSQNELFVKLLASRLSDKEIYTASLAHASALGAALVVEDDEVNGEALKDLLALRRHMPLKDLDIEQYSWEKSAAL